MATKRPASNASFKLVRFLLFLTRIVPLKLSYSFCSFLAFIGSGLNWKRKEIAMDNLRIVFPEKTEKERRSIFRESLRNMLKSIFEFAYMASGKYTGDRISEMASASGLEQLDNLQKNGQGALLYSGHFGNFALMIIWLAIKGYPVAAIYKEAKNFPDDFFGNILRKFNITPLKYTLDSALSSEVIRALKEKKIVFIQNDQSYPDGVYVNFFNKSVPSAPGPALLAKRAGVPIIPSLIFRDKNNHHKIEILPEISLQQENDLRTFISTNTQILIDWIAELLLKHPTEWLWLHNRWKRASNRNEGELGEAKSREPNPAKRIGAT
jgi:KDO2-lipid IV(A) lauroyltransferase